MKIDARPRRLLVLPSLAPFGNNEPYLRTELRELEKHFERIAIAPVRTPSGTRQNLAPGIEVVAWPLLSPGILRRALRSLARAPKRTFSALAAVLTSREAGLLKNAAVVLKALALADWVREHSFDHVHAYWVSTPATVAMIAARVAGVPWSATAHRWDIYERNAFDVKMRDAAFIRTISERGMADMRSAMPFARERIVRVPLGAAIPSLPVLPQADLEELHAICPAALVAVKGHEDLLDAVAALCARGLIVHCTLAGEGPLRERLVKRVAELGLEHAVDMPGFVPQQQLHEWYRGGRFNAVVLASRQAPGGVMEGIPSALLEAMAFGVPVVATDSGSVRELVDESCGHLVPCGDPAALANALADVHAQPQLAMDRAKRAYERVAAQHDVGAQMRAFAAMIGGGEGRT